MQTLSHDFKTARALTQDEQFEDAILAYQKILQAEPTHIPSHYNLGLLFAKIGKPSIAHEHFEQVTKLAPDYPQGYFQFAQILLVEAQPSFAIKQLQIAVELNSDYLDAQHLLACTLMQQGQVELAKQHFEYILQRYPDYANAKLNFALLKLQQKETIMAQQLLDEALSIDPTLIEAHYHRGVIAMQQGDIEHAILEMQETLDRNADHFAANYNLAILYKMQNHYKLAVFYLKKAQALKPEDESIAFLLASFSQENTPDAAPQNFVRELFDHYAQNYDQHMEKTLQYKTPQQLRELFNTAAIENSHQGMLDSPPLEKGGRGDLKIFVYNQASQNPPLDAGTPFFKGGITPLILDLGCGTGLVGKYFNDLNAKFIGIDLSDEMLQQAKQRNIYQTLHQIDILEYLKTTQEKFDLIIAAEVLNYFGPLDKLFSACTHVLKESGLILFSIELTNDGDYQLHTSARFAHHEAYITALANTQNWTLIAKENQTLRLHENIPVQGMLFLYCRTRHPRAGGDHIP